GRPCWPPREAAPSEGPVTENTFQQRLEELQRHFAALPPLSDDDFGQTRELLPGSLPDLQRAVEELQDIVAGPPENGGHDGKPSNDAQLGKGLRFHAMADRGPILVRIVGSHMAYN